MRSTNRWYISQGFWNRWEKWEGRSFLGIVWLPLLKRELIRSSVLVPLPTARKTATFKVHIKQRKRDIYWLVCKKKISRVNEVPEQQRCKKVQAAPKRREKMEEWSYAQMKSNCGYQKSLKILHAKYSFLNLVISDFTEDYRMKPAWFLRNIFFPCCEFQMKPFLNLSDEPEWIRLQGFEGWKDLKRKHFKSNVIQGV